MCVFLKCAGPLFPANQIQVVVSLPSNKQASYTTPDTWFPSSGLLAIHRLCGMEARGTMPGVHSLSTRHLWVREGIEPSSLIAHEHIALMLHAPFPDLSGSLPLPNRAYMNYELNPTPTIQTIKQNTCRETWIILFGTSQSR
jgi:hypothetical protein